MHGSTDDTSPETVTLTRAQLEVLVFLAAGFREDQCRETRAALLADPIVYDALAASRRAVVRQLQRARRVDVSVPGLRRMRDGLDTPEEWEARAHLCYRAVPIASLWRGDADGPDVVRRMVRRNREAAQALGTRARVEAAAAR